MMSGLARIGIAALIFAASAAAEEAPDTLHPDVTHAKNFTLKDYLGKEHTLFDNKDAEAVVVYVHGIGCPIVRLSVPEIEEIKKKFADKKVHFFMINANPLDTPEDLKQDAAEFSISMPILMDITQEVSKSLGVQRTATCLVIDPQEDWRIVYRGAISNRHDYGTRRQHGFEDWLITALDEHLAGNTVSKPVTQPKGCLVNYLHGEGDGEKSGESNPNRE